MLFTDTRPSIPGPTAGPDPLAELRAARAWLLRLLDRPCSAGSALEAFIAEAGPVAAAEQLCRGEVPEPVTELVSRAHVHTALAGVAGDGDAAARCGARLLIPEDAAWPAAATAAGVVGLWVRGHAAPELLAGPTVSLTGSAAATSYGTHVAAELAGELAAAGRTVVAGSNFGVEAAAHRGALAAQAATVVVLAGGIDRAHPVAHEHLLERIAAAGLLVSVHPPRATFSRDRARRTGRLLAALGEATVVVEAATRCGALRTAAAAHALGRPVGAVPGPVTSTCSTGTHRLLRRGATLVTSGADVAAALDTPRPAEGPSDSGHRQQPATSVEE